MEEATPYEKRNGKQDDGVQEHERPAPCGHMELGRVAILKDGPSHGDRTRRIARVTCEGEVSKLEADAMKEGLFRGPAVCLLCKWPKAEKVAIEYTSERG